MVVKPKEVAYDFSAMSDYLKCKMRGYYRHDLNLTPKKPHPALAFGQAFHEAMANWYKTGDKDKAIYAFTYTWNLYLNKAQEELEDAMINFPLDDSKRNLENGIKILDGYFERYQKEPFKVLSNEFPFKVDLATIDGVEYKLTGKIDLMVEWGKFVYITDHKTTSMLGGSFFDQFNPSLQVDGYVYAAKKIFGKCDGALINAVLVAKTKQTYERDIFGKTEEDMALYMDNVIEIMYDIEESKRRGKFPRNTDACTLYGACPFLELCRAKGDERVMRNRYKVEPWSPFNV